MKRLLIVLTLVSAHGFGQTRPAARPAQKKAAAPAAAPAPAPPRDRWPIEGLAVEGSRNYQQEQVLAIAGLKTGQLAGKVEFEAARDRLIASGAFETVGYRFAPGPGGAGYVASFQVVDVEPAYPVRFEELGVPAEEIDAMMREKDPLYSRGRMPATAPVLERHTRWIQEYLGGKGIREKIAGRVVAVGPEKFEILFRPARNLPAVAQVTFEGNQVVPQSVLLDAAVGVTVGSPYTEERFRELLNTSVRPIYEARGRVSVSFPKIRTEPAKDVQGLHVFVTVDEGQSYELGKVAIEGASPLPAPGLLKAADFKTGDVANFDRVNEGLDRIRKALRRAGYMQNKVTADRKIDDAKKTVDLGVRIEPGPQFLMGQLVMVGLDLHGEFEMKRMWAAKPGKPFNADYPEIFLNSVREQGVFENLGKTRSEINVNPQDNTVDVTLTFGGEAPPKIVEPKTSW